MSIRSAGERRSVVVMCVNHDGTDADVFGGLRQSAPNVNRERRARSFRGIYQFITTEGFGHPCQLVERSSSNESP